MTKKKKNIIITVSSILGVIVLLMGTFLIYTAFYYHTDTVRANAYIASRDVTITEVSRNKKLIKGKAERAGIIFYPGGKVEYTAYEPLLASLAEEGYTSVLLKMPFNLAVFGSSRADGIKKEYPEITTWYLMGHSLGGAIISQYASYHSSDYEGLILLGAYPYKDISSTSLKLLNIYGSEDKVLDMSKYEGSKSKWPSSTKEYVIEGGCHAGFGMYGAQKGDGTPSITNEEQIELTTQAVVDYFG